MRGLGEVRNEKERREEEGERGEWLPPRYRSMKQNAVVC